MAKFETHQQVMDAFDECILGVAKEEPKPDPASVVLKKENGSLVQIDSLDVSSNVKTLLKEIDTEGNGCVDDENVADMLTVMRTMKSAFGSKGKISHSEVQDGLGLLERLVNERAMNSDEMSYKHMPDCIQDVMKEWDLDRSGSVNVLELSAAAKAHKKVKDEGRMMKRIILVLFAVIVLLLAGMFVMSYIAVDMAKEMRGNSDGVMQNADGEVVKVASSAFDVQSDGTLVMRGNESGSNVLEVAESTPKRRLSSTVPDDYFKTLKKVTLKDGEKFLQATVTGMKRLPMRSSRCGSVVELETTEGVLTLDDYILSADEAFTAFLTKAGMPNILGGDGLFGRRLSENSLLEGFFGKLKEVEWKCESVPLPKPEDIPQFYYAKLHVTQDAKEGEQVYSTVDSTLLLPGIVKENGRYLKKYTEEVLQTSSVTVKARQFTMHPLQKQLSIGRNGAQALVESMGDIGYGCVAGLPPSLDVAALITKASGISLVGFTNEGGRVLRQWRLQVDSLPTDNLTKVLGQSGMMPAMSIDYFDVDTDPTGVFEAGKPYRVHAFAPSGGRPNVTLQYAEISAVSDMDLAGALNYFGVTKLAADCEKDVFVASKQPFITLTEELGQLARAANPQKVPKIDPWVEHPAVVAYNRELLKDLAISNAEHPALSLAQGSPFWETMTAMATPEIAVTGGLPDEEYDILLFGQTFPVKVTHCTSSCSSSLPGGRSTVTVNVSWAERNLDGVLEISQASRVGGRAKSCMTGSFTMSLGGLWPQNFAMGTQLCLIEDFQEVSLSMFNYPISATTDDVEVTVGQHASTPIANPNSRRLWSTFYCSEYNMQCDTWNGCHGNCGGTCDAYCCHREWRCNGEKWGLWNGWVQTTYSTCRARYCSSSYR